MFANLDNIQKNFTGIKREDVSFILFTDLVRIIIEMIGARVAQLVFLLHRLAHHRYHFTMLWKTMRTMRTLRIITVQFVVIPKSWKMKTVNN